MEIRTYIDTQDGNGFKRMYPVKDPEFEWKEISGFDALRLTISNNLEFTNDYLNNRLDYDRINSIPDLTVTARIEVRFYYPETQQEHLFQESFFQTIDFQENDLDKNWIVVKPRTWDKYHELIKVYSDSYNVYNGVSATNIAFPTLGSIATIGMVGYVDVPDPAGNNNDDFIIFDDFGNEVPVRKSGENGGVAFATIIYCSYTFNKDLYEVTGTEWEPIDNSFLYDGGFIYNGYFARQAKSLWSPIGYVPNIKHPDMKAFRLYDIISNMINNQNVGLSFRCDDWINDTEFYNVFMSNPGTRTLIDRNMSLKELMDMIEKVFNGGWRINGNELIFEPYRSSTVVNGSIDLTAYVDSGINYGNKFAKRINNILIKDPNIPISEVVKLGSGNDSFSKCTIKYPISSYGDIDIEPIDISVETDFIKKDVDFMYQTSDEVLLLRLKQVNNEYMSGYAIEDMDVNPTFNPELFNAYLKTENVVNNFWLYKRYLNDILVNDVSKTAQDHRRYKDQKASFPFSHYVFNWRDRIKTEQGWGEVKSAKWANGTMEVELKF